MAQKPTEEKPKSKSSFPAPTVSQLEEALEERTKPDRRETDNSSGVELDRRVGERRATKEPES